ncbi:hypothetical protein SteCoe_13668 [Stentor coeruleus]|uniref:Uncharacterized protein n=1 Tax=Stentor coeruleus TaxID=5963 RepID=A0A1R2C7T6_9CILI|nr:hypothetical protein SteCoe_13668 [Stentor coeruleus]
MEYSQAPLSLFPKRIRVLESDIWNIVDSGDFSSIENFKTYWKKNNLSMIHQCIHEKELPEEFYHALYNILTGILYIDYIRTSSELAVKSIYVLYTVYFTQIRKKILIPVQPETIAEMIKVAKLNLECKNMIAKLNREEAFSFVVREGIKSYVRMKKNQREVMEHEKFSSNSEFQDKIMQNIEFDSENIHKLSMKYATEKEKIKKLLKDNIDLFQTDSFPNGKITEHFRVQNDKMLELANLMLPLEIPSKLKSINKITNS